MIERIPQLLADLTPTFRRCMTETDRHFTDSERKKIHELQNAYDAVKSLVVVRLDAIGDWVLFYSSLRKLKSIFRNAEITLVAYRDVRDVIQGCPYVKGSFLLDRSGMQSSKAVREHILGEMGSLNFDLLFNPLYSREFTSEEIAHFIRAKVKIGVAGDNTNISTQLRQVVDSWYSYLLPVDNTNASFELHRDNEIMSLLGVESEISNLPEVALPDQDQHFVDELLKKFRLRNYVVVFPSGRGGQDSPKYWGTDNFTRLVDALSDKGPQVVVLGGPEDEVCTEIARRAKHTVVVLKGQTTLWQSAAIVKRSLFYVGTDTSMAHISAGLKVPTVVILAGVQFGRFFPYPPEVENVISVYKKLPCFNCNWRCTRPSFECINQITLDEVLGACDRALSMSEPPRQLVLSGSANEVPSRINIVNHLGSAPKVDLILPNGNHSWHLQEGWIATLRERGYLNRVFWAQDSRDNRLYDYLKTGGTADLLFALGGDHHLWFLHNTQNKHDVWSRYKGHRVCYSYESTRDTFYPRYLSRVQTSFRVFTHFLYTDEVDGSLYEKRGLPAIWFPQFAEHKMFTSWRPFKKRIRKAVFFGKFWSEYSARRETIEALANSKLCDHVDFSPTGELANKYNEYMFSVNPPGVVGAFNTRAFETLGCGGLLFQFLPANRPLNNALFKHGEHLIYYLPNDLKGLISQLRYAANDPEPFLQVARKGHEEFLENHTLEKRMDQMLNWVLNGQVPVYPNYGPPQLPGIAEYDRQIGLHHKDTFTSVQKGKTLDEIAALRGAGRLEDAIAVAEDAVKNSFGSHEFWNILAELRIQNQNYEEAEMIVSNILGRMPADVQALNNLAVLYIMSKRYNEAISTLSNVLLADPGNQAAIGNLNYLKHIMESAKANAFQNRAYETVK